MPSRQNWILQTVTIFWFSTPSQGEAACKTKGPSAWALAMVLQQPAKSMLQAVWTLRGTWRLGCSVPHLQSLFLKTHPLWRTRASMTQTSQASSGLIWPKTSRRCHFHVGAAQQPSQQAAVAPELTTLYMLDGRKFIRFSIMSTGNWLEK